jgi:hypothetical protein
MERAIVSLALVIASSVFVLPSPAHVLPVTESITIAELQSRRKQVLMQIPNGIILLHANSGWTRWEDSGFRQDADFFYLTGLKNLQRAIPALDGVTKESWLFVSPPSVRDKDRTIDLQGMDSAVIDTGSESARQLGMVTRGKIRKQHLGWKEVKPRPI